MRQRTLKRIVDKLQQFCSGNLQAAVTGRSEMQILPALGGKIPEDATLLDLSDCWAILLQRASESGVGTIEAIRQRDGIVVEFTCWLAGQFGNARYGDDSEKFYVVPNVEPVALNYQESANGNVIYSSTVQQALKEGRYDETDRFYLLHEPTRKQ